MLRAQYFLSQVAGLYHAGAIEVVEIERHNETPAPDQERFLLRLTASDVESLDLDT